MRYLFAALLMLYCTQTMTEQITLKPWDDYAFGAPCTTETDRRELSDADGICQPPVTRRRPDWNAK